MNFQLPNAIMHDSLAGCTSTAFLRAQRILRVAIGLRLWHRDALLWRAASWQLRIEDGWLLPFTARPWSCRCKQFYALFLCVHSLAPPSISGS